VDEELRFRPLIISGTTGHLSIKINVLLAFHMKEFKIQQRLGASGLKLTTFTTWPQTPEMLLYHINVYNERL
jgi:hypothetical protein